MEEQTYKMACYHWWNNKKHTQTPLRTPPLDTITIAVIISIQLNEPSRDNINQKRRWNSDDHRLIGDTKMYRDFARFHFNHTHAHTWKYHTKFNAQATNRKRETKKVAKAQATSKMDKKREEKSRKQIELNLKMGNSKAHNARNGDNMHTHTTFGIPVKHFHIHSWDAIDVQAHFI